MPTSSATGVSRSDSGFHCDVSGCSRSFTRQADMKRHKLNHSSESFRYRCGCCEFSQGSSYTCLRKDHMKQHMTKKHRSPCFYTCKCEADSELDFSLKLCFLIHKRGAHGLSQVEEGEYQSKLRSAAKFDCYWQRLQVLRVTRPRLPSIAAALRDQFHPTHQLKEGRSRVNIALTTLRMGTVATLVTASGQ